MKFRKKPVVIDAVQWNGGNFHEIRALEPRADIEVDGAELLVHTLEGCMTASEGDWIIRGVQGELYPCKPQIFDATYEPAE